MLKGILNEAIPVKGMAFFIVIRFILSIVIPTCGVKNHFAFIPWIKMKFQGVGCIHH